MIRAVVAASLSAVLLSSCLPRQSSGQEAPFAAGHEHGLHALPPPEAYAQQSRQFGELEYLAVDIARRAVLALHPHASHAPIRTVELMVRPEGDEVHTYAKVVWFTTKGNAKRYTSEVYATLVYTPGVRRVFDLSYKDNYWVPHRDFARTSDLISRINDELEQRDPLRMPHPLVGPQLDQLAPRRRSWSWNPFGGDHPWHVSIADDRVHPAFIPLQRQPAAP